MTEQFKATTILLVLLCFFSLYRAWKGPTPADRVVAISVISTEVSVIIALLATIEKHEFYLDVALIFALIGFIAPICIAKFIEKGRLD